MWRSPGRHPKALSGYEQFYGLIEQALMQLELGDSGGLVKISKAIGWLGATEEAQPGRQIR
jgi:hypothetical protein